VSRVLLGEGPLSVDAILAEVHHPGAGAVALFLGTVRDHNDGRAVTRLEYEAYGAMALAEMERIVREIEESIPGARCALAHRVGALEVGETAVVCAASAPHRPEAFAACRRLIDEVKARVPIWKREHGPDGPYWVGWEDARCAHPEPGRGAAGVPSSVEPQALEHELGSAHDQDHGVHPTKRERP
jgi:molybdopterin synthase catalytic subunit